MTSAPITFCDLPVNVQGYIASFSPTPMALERVSQHFKGIVVPATIQEHINCLLKDENCKQAMKRFHLTMRSFFELKHPFLEKIKSLIQAILPRKILTSLPRSFQATLQPSYISPKEVYRSFFVNLKTLKKSLAKDVPHLALRNYSIQEMIISPQKLTEYLDGVYLSGIIQILRVTQDSSPTIRNIFQQISEKNQASASEAVRLAFQLTTQLGPKIATELEGHDVSIRNGFFDWAKTTWFADPTFYPQEFVNLLQSPSIKLTVSGGNSHKPYCYCRFAPDNCRLSRRLSWRKQ